MKKGMIKVSVLYPNVKGGKFNMDYYTTEHVALVSRLLGDSLKGATIEKGLGGAAPDSSAPYIAMGNLYFDTLEYYANSFGPNAVEIMEDLPNFTDIDPLIQVSEVMI